MSRPHGLPVAVRAEGGERGGRWGQRHGEPSWAAQLCEPAPRGVTEAAPGEFHTGPTLRLLRCRPQEALGLAPAFPAAALLRSPHEGQGCTAAGPFTKTGVSRGLRPAGPVVAARAGG